VPRQAAIFLFLQVYKINVLSSKRRAFVFLRRKIAKEKHVLLHRFPNCIIEGVSYGKLPSERLLGAFPEYRCA
jgi:hypothetical protein